MPVFEPFSQLPQFALTFGVKFVAAFICGGLIGLERESSGKPAGLRTNVLICLGAMLFTTMSFEMATTFGGDKTRIAAQIVTGIGFLGAGAILHERGKGITGMTTAALIWMTAALGLMIGGGYVITAIVLAALVTGAMLVLRRAESWVNRRTARAFTFSIPGDVRSRERLQSLFSMFDEALLDVTLTWLDDQRIGIGLRFVGSAAERTEFLQSLYTIDGVRRGTLPEPTPRGAGTPDGLDTPVGRT